MYVQIVAVATDDNNKTNSQNRWQHLNSFVIEQKRNKFEFDEMKNNITQ